MSWQSKAVKIYLNGALHETINGNKDVKTIDVDTVVIGNDLDSKDGKCIVTDASQVGLLIGR